MLKKEIIEKRLDEIINNCSNDLMRRLLIDLKRDIMKTKTIDVCNVCGTTYYDPYGFMSLCDNSNCVNEVR